MGDAANGRRKLTTEEIDEIRREKRISRDGLSEAMADELLSAFIPLHAEHPDRPRMATFSRRPCRAAADVTVCSMCLRISETPLLPRPFRKHPGGWPQKLYPDLYTAS